MDKQEDTAEHVDPKKIYDRAREIIKEIEVKPGCNALLLTYDPNAEKFQFLAMHADADEVFALLLSGMGVLKDAADAARQERTLN
jgi:hypothetical protein